MFSRAYDLEKTDEGAWLSTESSTSKLSISEGVSMLITNDEVFHESSGVLLRVRMNFSDKGSPSDASERLCWP